MRHVRMRRVGKALGPERLTREDRIDMEMADAAMRDIAAHPEKAIPLSEVERRLALLK